MKKLTLICLVNILLTFSICLAAEAKISIGLASSLLPAKPTMSAVENFAQGLSNSAGATIKVKSFDNEALLSNWLLRFQEIDAAIVSQGFIKQQAAGTLTHLLDIHLAESGKPPLGLAVRQNVGRNVKEQIKKAGLTLTKTSKGMNILNQVGLSGITLPGAKLARKPHKTPQTTSAKTVKKAPIKTQDKPKVASKALPAQKTVKKPAAPINKETVTAKKAEALQAPVTGTEPKVAAEEKPGRIAKESIAAPTTNEPSVEPAKVIESAPAATTVTEDDQAETKNQTPPEQPANQVTTAKDIKPETKTSKRLTVFIALIILAAVAVKCLLIFFRWQSKRHPSSKQHQATTIEQAFVEPMPEAEESVPTIDNNQPLVIESGVLGPGKVPKLLKRCADLPRPAVLKVIKGGSEKLVYFAGGQVSGALTQNREFESEVRWNKLASLLVREELITSEEVDQGMELVTNEPDLHLGEALLKLGLIDMDGLRHALTRQAKVTIYSLILFPEGRYQVVDETSALPPEESISLEVSNLIREASHHQSEWTEIRQALPNLNKTLGFSKEGLDKLENVNLSAQQKTTLQLVDGKKTINDLCMESSMLDYEVYRFLYLMVKTGVLQ
jgi:hypothetical protein